MSESESKKFINEFYFMFSLSFDTFNSMCGKTYGLAFGNEE